VDGVRVFEATSIIAASPENVWAVLTDVASWPDWESGIVRVKGDLEIGRKLQITNAGKAGKGFPFTVTAIEPVERIALIGVAKLGLFTGERTYLLSTKSRGTRFRMREEYHGRLASMIVQAVPDLTASFQQFADGLKERAERQPTGGEPKRRRR